MKILRNIFDVYLKSSLHVAFAVFSLVKVVEFSFHLTLNLFLKTAIFSGSILVYNVLKNYQFWKSKHFSFFKNISVLLITIGAFFVFLYCFFQLNICYQFAFFYICIPIVLYSFLRKFWYFKIVTVSFCVTYVVSYISTLHVTLIGKEIAFFQIKLFFLICALMIPFEIYDTQFDAPSLQTIPQKFGVRKAKICGYVFLFIFCFTSLFSSGKFVAIDLFIALLTTFFIKHTSVSNSKYYTSFWVESIPVFWWVLLIIFG